MTKATQLSCKCGQIHIEVTSTPIVNAECCCNSCREAGARLRSLPSAPTFLEANGNTRFVLYRKDRVKFVKGAEHLKEMRLKPTSTTRRVVAVCCNTPVFLEFHNGHWLSLYGYLWPSEKLPPLDMRTMTKDLPEGTVLPNDVPNAGQQTVGFMFKLLGAWIAMRFKVPKVTVNGELHV
jgi:hypothetical protein